MALSVTRLTAWLSAILRRIETEHPETNFNQMMSLGEAVAFPTLLAPDNDDQPHGVRPPDDPCGSES